MTEFEVLRNEADAYLSTGRASTAILAKQVCDLAATTDIVSIRAKEDYERAHICGAVNVPWGPDFIDEWFNRKITDNQQVIIYSYNGHLGEAATALLNLLGFDAVNMQWGYTSWMWCVQKAPAEFVSAKGKGLGMNYPVETTVNDSDKKYQTPDVNNTDSEDRRKIIMAAITKWLKNKAHSPIFDEGPQFRTEYPFITPKELFYWLHNENPDDQPLVVSIRDPEQYKAGHVPGAINIPLAQLTKAESLQKLPPDKAIVIVSNDGMSGSQAMAILSIMGYDAQNLLFGMTGWTQNDVIAPNRYQRYITGTREYKDVMDYAFCTGSDPGSYFQPDFQQCMDSF